MRCAAVIAVVGLCSVLFPLRGLGQKITFPKKSDGYDFIKPIDSSQPAPAGYEGRTDGYSTTAVGNTDATRGKKFVSHFSLGNEIKICPQADGTSEGDGALSGGIEYTDAAGAAISVQVHATAKYKGKVGDNALLDGPITAEIDYTFKQTGSWGGHGAKLSAANIDDAQHVTIKFLIKPGEMTPSYNAFEGGDPAQGHLSEAFTAGTIVTFWSAIFYSAAETDWTKANRCAQIVFDPPSESRQPVPGSEVKVNAQVKSKAGGVTKANYSDPQAFPGGGSVLGNGSSDVGSPAIFTYTAPNKTAEKMGFEVDAGSRAGVAKAEWRTGLGTGWSGRITVSSVSDGDVGQNELQFWSNSSTTQSTITVKDGVATAYVYYEMQSISSNKERALRNGAITLINVNSDNREGSAEATGKTTLGVELSPDGTSYTLMASFGPAPPGKSHETSCERENCTSVDTPLPIAPFLPQITGKYDNPNILQGSQNSTTTGQGYSKKGKTTFNVTWYLERRGTTK